MSSAHTPDRAGGLYFLAAAAVILNLMDGVFTLIGVGAGTAVEANPLMASLLDTGPVMFIAGKLALVSLGLLLLWRHRARTSAAAGIVAAAAVYFALFIYHVHAIATL